MTFEPAQAAEDLAAELQALGTPERAVREKRYLKSELEFFGVTVPDIRRTVKAAARRYPELDREAAVAWAQALWRVPVHERRMAAVETLKTVVLKKEDLDAVEGMIREAGTWALVDGLAENVAGVIAQHDETAWARIDEWARDDDFWVRRSALLALLPGVRAGKPDLDRFQRYATLSDTEFFIRKAIGWVLREISRRDPDWVAAWTGAHLEELSGVTFREAVRRLPADEAAHLTALRAARRAAAGRPPLAVEPEAGPVN